MEYVLQTFDLKKRYKRHFAVNGACMNITKGDIYGFVGENGSGKTTIIRMISGIIFPHSGSFELFGVSSKTKDIIKTRKRIGAIVESPSVYLNMSAYDNLKNQCTLLGIKDLDKIRAVLKVVGLESLYEDKKQAVNYSLGMRQRLGIAMALLGEPEFIMLDEPMNGLDPAGIVEIRELILKLNQEKNITFLISSHILTELSLVATKYGIISKGKIIKEITAEELKEECGKVTVIESDDPYALHKLLKDENIYRLSSTARGIKISGEVELNPLLHKILNAGIKITNINCSESSIEDYYLSVLGGANND